MKNYSWADDCPFPPELPTFNKERLLFTWEKFKAGNTALKEDLILELLASGKAILLHFATKYPAVRPIYRDVAGDVILQTCIFVGREELPDYDNVLASYWHLVRHVVHDAMQDTMMQTARSRRRQIRNSESLSERETLDEETCYFEESHTLDTLEELKAVAYTDLERTYLDLTLAGHSREEIAAQLGLDVSRCSKLKNTLRSRYEDRQ
jgi:hypothetical protein